jgi:flagellar assembly protein FliH
MINVAQNPALLGYLRDIRLSGIKRQTKREDGYAARGANRQGDASDESGEAKTPGFERGRKEAEQQFERRVEELKSEWEAEHRTEVVQALETLNTSIHKQMSQVFKSLEKHMMMLAAEAAIRLTAGIPVTSDMVEACVREAVAPVENDSEVMIILNPEDYALLEQHQSSLLNRAGAHPVFKFRSDAKIARGGCLVETKFGELDARRETKIELLRKAVNE